VKRFVVAVAVAVLVRWGMNVCVSERGAVSGVVEWGNCRGLVWSCLVLSCLAWPGMWPGLAHLKGYFSRYREIKKRERRGWAGFNLNMV